MTSIKVTNISVQPLFLGFTGENDSRPVSVDVSPWLKEFPEGTVSIVYTRSDGLTYAVVVNQIGPVVTWKPLEADLVEGKCRLQIQIKQGDAVKKDRVVDCIVGKSLDDPSDPPQEPRPTYVEQVIDAADRAEDAVSHYPQIRAGYWWMWDVSSGEWVNTGDSANGLPGKSAYQIAVDNGYVGTEAEWLASLKGAPGADGQDGAPGAPGADGADGVSPTVTVTAIEGGHRVTITDADGAHTFDVMDGEGGGVTDAVLYTPQTLTDAQQEQARENIGAGTYSKPSGGIPASDLAAGVIPVVPQMATDPDMEDWTSGKTVDAATMKTVVTAAGLKVAALEDDVSELERDKANASDVYTKTEINQKLVGAMVYKGTKETIADLPSSENETGDVWHVNANGAEYGWNGTEWEELGTEIDFSVFAEKTWVEGKGYQTAQQVQTAISGVRQLPAVTAADNGKSLVVENGAWAVGSGGSGLPDATSASAGDFLRLDAQKNAAWETVLSVMGASIPLGN